jgi:hypothetical protein
MEDINSKIRDVFYFISVPFTSRNYHRLGILQMIENGFDVYIYDFTPIINPRIYATENNDPISFSNYVLFHDQKEAINSIYEINNNDYVILTIMYTREQYWVFRALSKVRVKYAMILSGGVPDYNTNKNNLDKIKNINSFSVLKNALMNLPYRAIFSKYRGIRGPDYIIAGGSISLTYYSFLVPRNSAEIIWAHGLDYDIYLEKRTHYVSKNKHNKGVFIDSGVLSAWWDTMASDGGLRKNALHAEGYTRKLCQFLTKIEERSNCEITIAAHPEYTGQDYPEEFGGRLTIVDKTFELIQDCDFIILHKSTASNYAVLLKKPAIFITT